MEMPYDGALVMPKNFATVDEEEMTYVDGGLSIQHEWWGFRLDLTAQECTDIAIAGGTGVTIATIKNLIPNKALQIILAVAEGYLLLCGNHNGAFLIYSPLIPTMTTGLMIKW
ncbi:MAG: hypothetical protein IJL32_03750 [Oscillospiraceae bacterium]|nr:hypothetical protein [Oscillospiraceae bacterium]